MRHKILIIFALILFASCADQLDVRNPNQPTADVNSENNILALSQGIYADGFRGLKYGGFQGTFLNDVLAYHEGMGDVIGCEAANVYINQLIMPDEVTLDNGTKVQNPANPKTQVGLLRFANQNSFADQSPVVYEWAYMYNAINLCNTILVNVDKITFSGDQESKRNTLRAWAFWWKGWAYGRIGSMYYAGVITDVPGKTNPNYKSKEDIIAESNSNYDKAVAALNAITVVADYTSTISRIIPNINQVGRGVSPTIDMFKRNISTMKARNILVNTKVSAMTSTQWNEIISLTNAGILSTTNVFTGRSNATGDFMSSTIGTVALVAAGDPSAVTYKISERLIQDFRAGDNRLAKNFETPVVGGRWLGNSDRGTIFNTRYRLVSGGTALGGNAIIYANRTAGQGEAFLAGTYEENELMKAEAYIRLGGQSNIDQGISIINTVRTFQGAGLAALASGLSQTAAVEELRSERRVALAFRGLSFYDARRWGVIDPVSSSGGRSGAVVLSATGAINTNATINYNYLDYWDVPDNDLVFNPPASGSAPVKNPRSN
ncbi:MAG: RagB/SusD family nutrient uptake outer membrane protein [Cyclobacteriaceae bacterium]|jgi:hypothetical protein|nr:RagB/SusD family nutrient uptake outer membrane protein [Flammeovirgaceae bacterium]